MRNLIERLIEEHECELESAVYERQLAMNDVRKTAEKHFAQIMEMGMDDPVYANSSMGYYGRWVESAMENAKSKGVVVFDLQQRLALLRRILRQLNAFEPQGIQITTDDLVDKIVGRLRQSGRRAVTLTLKKDLPDRRYEEGISDVLVTVLLSLGFTTEQIEVLRKG